MASWQAKTAYHDDDAELVERTRQGDRVSFEKLYRRHRNRVYGLMWRLCGGDPALAEDLLQEAFVRAWQKLDSFRGDSRFGTWLHRLSVNVALSDRRSRLLDEVALVEGLGAGRLCGAALDVFETEPLTAAAGARFKGVANLILTPHIAGQTQESNIRVGALVAERVTAHLEGLE